MKKISLLVFGILCVVTMYAQTPVAKSNADLNFWFWKFNDVTNLTTAKMAELDKMVAGKIDDLKLSKEEKAKIIYTNQLHKVVEVWRFLIKPDVKFDRKVFAFIKKVNLDNAYLQDFPSIITLFNSYYRIKDEYNGVYVPVIGAALEDPTEKMVELLAMKNIQPAVNQYIKSTFDYSTRYVAYADWMDNPKIINSLQDEKLKTNITTFAKKYHYLRVGGEAPEFRLMDSMGNYQTLSQHKGKVVVIDLWGTWCSGCIKAMPKFVEIKNKYKERNDIVFMTIAAEHTKTFDLWKTFINKLGIGDMVSLYANRYKEMPVALEFFEDYNFHGAPRYFIIGKDGKFRSVYYPYPEESKFVDIINNALK